MKIYVEFPFQNSQTQWVKSTIAHHTIYNDSKNKHLKPVKPEPIADESLNSGK